MPYSPLKELTDSHRTAATLLAQGLPRAVVSEATGFNVDYLSGLCRDPLFKGYMQDMMEIAQTRLEAMFTETVEVIGDSLRNGSEDGKLRAARLQMEATGRVGKQGMRTPVTDQEDRLLRLSERLVDLLHVNRRRTFDGEAKEVREQEEEGQLRLQGS